MNHKLFSYNGHKVYLEKTSYRNNNTLAVTMCTENGDTYNIITVNLNSPMQDDTMAFIDTNNCPGIEKFIQKNKLGIPMHYSQQSGFCSFPLYTLFPEKF